MRIPFIFAFFGLFAAAFVVKATGPHEFLGAFYFFILFSSLAGWLMGYWIAASLSSCIPRREEVSIACEIVPMRGFDSPSGVYICASESIGSGIQYSFAYDNGDGSFSLSQVPVDSRLRVVEDSALEGVGGDPPFDGANKFKN